LKKSPPRGSPDHFSGAVLPGSSRAGTLIMRDLSNFLNPGGVIDALAYVGMPIHSLPTISYADVAPKWFGYRFDE